MGLTAEAEPASRAAVRGLPIIAYHFLNSPDAAYTFGNDETPYVLGAHSFQDHLDGLASAGYATISLTEYIRGGELPPRPVVLTFDDGHVSCHDIMLSLLSEKGYQAVLFIPTNFIGEAGCLTEGQLVELSQLGMQIGSHGCSHRALTALPVCEMKDELRRSKGVLEDITGRVISVLALPHGFGSRVVEHTAREAGYHAICTSRFGVNDARLSSFCLKRIGVKNSASWNALEPLMRSGTLPHTRGVLVDRVKDVGKWMLQTHKRCG